jgi:hypothetical protein
MVARATSMPTCFEILDGHKYQNLVTCIPRLTCYGGTKNIQVNNI